MPEKVKSINIYSHTYGLLSAKYNKENIMNLEEEKKGKDKPKIGAEITIGYSERDQKY